MILLDSLIRHCAVAPGFTQMIRWQSHWYVVRQSWPFFQNDFAGRIASRVMQNGMYARLWQRQSGGFLGADLESA